MSAWSEVTLPAMTATINSVATNETGSVIMIGPDFKNLYKSTDGGQTWVELSNFALVSGTKSNVQHVSTVVSNDAQTIFAAITCRGTHYIQKSIDGGNTWASKVSIPNASSIGDLTSLCSSSNLSTIYYSRQRTGIFKSIDGGDNWTQVLINTDVVWCSVSCSADGSVVAAVPGNLTAGPVHISKDGGATWTTHGDNYNYNSVVVAGNGSIIYATPNTNNIIVINNNAGTITPGPSLTTTECTDVITSYDGNIMLACGINRTVYKSTDRGITITEDSISSGIPGRTNILAATKTADKAYIGGSLLINPPFNYAPKLHSYSGVGSDVSAPTAPCFLADARVQTPSGPIAIADIKEGDLVLSAAGKPVSVRRVITKTVKPTIQNVPYIIPAGTWGAQVDLPISPDHRIVVPQRGLVKAAKLNLDRLIMTAPFTYYNLEVENCDNIVVEGVVVESFAHAKQYRLTMTEFATVCKDLAHRGKTDMLEKLLKAARQQGANVHLPLYVQRA